MEQPTQAQQDSARFDEWAIVEIMGHQKYAGRVTEQTIGGSAFVRVDVARNLRHEVVNRWDYPRTPLQQAIEYDQVPLGEVISELRRAGGDWDEDHEDEDET